jgi:hypothetical protein
MTRQLLSSSSDRLPRYIESAMQGLVFWIGHRRCIYPDYDLGEAALVAELANLIQARIYGDYRLLCEVHHNRFLQSGCLVDNLSASTRCDLLIGSHLDPRNKKGKVKPQAVMEIKRWSESAKPSIELDLRRLCQIKRAMPSVRCWLFVVSQGAVPTRFLNDKKSAKRGRMRDGLDDPDSYYNVRRVCKAASSFTRTTMTNYCCVLELFVGLSEN